MFSEPEDHEDDVEVFKDAPDSDAENEDGDAAEGDVSQAALPKASSRHYDGRKRDPQYANAQNSCIWEIVPLLTHYHPSVALHASQLLYGQTITTKPDLGLHTLSHFLDRFVYRNPKKALPSSASSIMKPGAKGQDTSGLVVMRKGASAPTISSEVPLNNENFAKKKEEQIPVDQLFFHRYFSKKFQDEESARNKVQQNKRKRKRGGDGDEDEDSEDDDISIGDDDAEAADVVPNASDLEDNDEDSDLDEDEVWKAMQASMPPAVGDADLMEDSGDDDEDDDDSVGEFAYSDSEEGEDDAAMDAVLAGEEDDEAEIADEADSDEAEEEDQDDDEEDEEEAENSDLAEDDDIPSFFPDEDMDDVPTFDEDEDDLIGSDEDIQLGDDVELPASAIAAGKKASAKNKKRKLKHLPAFASAEDWADLIEGHDSE